MPFAHPDDAAKPSPFGPQHHKTIVTDSELFIRQAFAVDVRRGYEAMFRRYYQSLCSQAVRFVYSRELAEDIVSDVLLNFWKNNVHLHITTSFRAYLFTAVRNQAYNYIQQECQKNSVTGPLPDEPDFLIRDDHDPHHILQLTEVTNQLTEAVRLLPAQCQRVFILSRFEGKKHREIADELHISPKTVEVHINKALGHLRKVLLPVLFFVTVWGQ